MIQFGVLGPLTVQRDGSVVSIGAPLQRAVLAVLLCCAGRPVQPAQLADALWEGDPPPSSRKTTQVYVHRLRRLLGADLPLHREPAGYRLSVAADQLDALRFAELLERGLAARRRGDLGPAGDLLREALGLWRGEPYAGALGGRLVALEARRLAEQRLLAIEERLAVDLDRGRHTEVVAELEALATAYPFRERLHGFGMLALYRSGRQADALDRFRATRTQLTEQLGIEPGPLLRRLHTAILRADGWLDRAPVTAVEQTEPAAPASASPSQPVPRELPAEVIGFVGRAEASAQLDALLPDPMRRPPTPMLAVVAGPPGVGKTSLAVHWGHRVVGAFPGGQLYLDLRGFDPGGVPVDPAQAVRRLLDTLRIPPDTVPLGLEAQAAAFRSRTADRRILLVLDNARDADQVRPLLPASTGAAVLITSRTQLHGLVASHAAALVSLAPFRPAEARELLVRRLGAERVAAEPQAVDQILTSCAGLPVALAVAAARAAAVPELPLELLATGLREAGGTLNALAGPDPAVDVRAVFSWSYHALDPPTARLFRLLGLHAGPELTGPAAASLAGVAVDQVEPMLTTLARAHLVTEPAPSRYALHDLLRSYATELNQAIDPETERRAGTLRLLDHYLHTAHAADRLLHPPPATAPIRLDQPQPGAIQQHLPDRNAAEAWLTTEHPVLLTTLVRAAATGFNTHTWQLAALLWNFLDGRGYLPDQILTEQAALTAARRAADRPREVLIHCVLARVYAKLGLYPDAHTHLGYATRLAAELGDPVERDRTSRARAFVADLQQR